MSTPDIGVIAGTSNTGLENANKMVRAVDPVMHYFQFDKHPLVSLLLTYGTSLVNRENSNLPIITGKSLKKKGYSNMKVEWFEDAALKRDFNPTASVAASDTSITVSTSDDDYFKTGDALLLTNTAGQTERVRISSVTAGTLNIVNDDGTTRTAGIVMTTADHFYLMENPRAEDSTANAIRTTKAANMYNYMEFISETYGLTEIKQATAHYTGDPMMEEKRKAYSRLLERLEMMFLFGTRAISGSTTNPVYQTGGLKYWLEAYSDVEIRNFSELSATKAELDSFLTAVGKGGSPDKVALVDSRWLAAINSMGYEAVQTNDYRVGEIGMNVKKIFGPMGTITLAYEPLFDQIATFNGSMMVVDLNDSEYTYLEGNGKNLDIKDHEIILADGSSANKGEYRGVCGIKFNTLKHFGWAKNLGA